jgi:hypothetical protein
MPLILAAIRRRLADERGFTMVTVMGVLLVATLFSVAAIAAADRDIPQSRTDLDRKQAYAAAEAGINDYMARLNQDSNYWTLCDNVKAPAPVNQPFTRTSPTQADPRKWRRLPGSTDAEYTIELIPAPGKTACDPADPAGSMINPNTQGFTIRATGRSRPDGQGTVGHRSIITRFRRRGFLDFLYFTDLETTDPEFFAGTANYNTMLTECFKYKRNGRSSPCTEITFIDDDQVNGPLHTNDRLLISGHPDFGRDKGDEIEVVAADGVGPPAGPAWQPNGSGNPEPWRGTFVPGAPRMDLPPSNGELEDLAGTVFTGDTELRFNGSTVTVRNRALNPTATNFESTWNLNSDSAFNGVIFVRNGAGCANPGTRTNPYPSPKDHNCANVWVSGRYDRSITIASQNDVVVKAGDDTGTGPGGKGIRRMGDAMMGLIANNFVRVYHPVAATPCTGSTANATGTETSVQIDAAILSLNHSFTVDNYQCGARLGTLTVNGAIAQKFRGPVGTFGGSGGTGYTKNYAYDDRLLYRAPPYFLDPVQSSWRTVRYTEQTPATK